MRLGRLFWKFLLVFWLAQLATNIVVSGMFWAFHNDRGRPGAEQPPGPPQWAGKPDRGPGRPPPGPPHDGPPDHHRPGPPDGEPPKRWQLPLMPFVVGSGVSLLFAWWMAAHFSRPIRSLRQAFAAEAAGQLDTRVGQSMGEGRDELVQLGHDFDHMAERLQRLVEGQRRLLHDVSHELRSPLARIQAATELMEQQPERVNEFVERIQKDTGHVDVLVGELLTLARLDAGVENFPRENMDLCDLLADIADDVGFEADHQGCHLSLECVAHGVVFGNSDLLRRAFENILRNAVRHTPEGTTVRATLQRQADTLLVSIQDAGTGVPESELGAIFEPFYRAGNAKPFEGYGLGLTIARQVARLHGGEITARNAAQGGLVVEVSLPLKGA